MKPDRRKLFEFDLQPRSAALRRLSRAGSSSLNGLLGLDTLNRLYHECTEGGPDCDQFLHRVLDWLRIKWRPSAEDLARIPRTGPLIVVANHPLGALEGLAMAATLRCVRGDVKLMANFMLGRIAELRDLFIFVDPFAAEHSTVANIAPLRESLRHLKRGGVLGVFPAGEVASFNPRAREIADPPWSDTVSRLVRRTGAPVLPMFFDGRNSILFQVMGVVHPRLRTALLARECMNHRGTQVVPRVGSLIPFNRLERLPGDETLTSYLRQRTYLLQHRRIDPAKPPSVPPQARIIPPVRPELLHEEIAALPAEQCLVRGQPLQTFFARAGQIPNALREIGRLREVAFRATGEGSGKEVDLDSFDADYVHLFLYHPQKREIVGGYRLGLTDEILAKRGRRGLYVSTLFDCKPQLLQRIVPALELGRSFVRPEYQKSFSPLLMLWRGIGQFIVRHPRYRYLMGPVSISNRYQSISKQLMVKFLQFHHCLPELVQLVQPRNPFRTGRIPGFDTSTIKLFTDSSEVSELVSDLEPQSTGIPVLLRQYLKLGAKMLAFNVDSAFADCVDGLMVCDLAKTDPRMLDRYFGVEGRKAFLKYHGIYEAYKKNPRASVSA